MPDREAAAMPRRLLIILALILSSTSQAGIVGIASLADAENHLQARTSPSDTTSYDVNAFIGANSFYNAGYTGSSAIVANIEAGNAWDGHESMSNLTQFLQTGTTATGEYDRHATWTAQVIAGTEGVASATPATYQRGIAYDATLWSGAIASSWNSAGAGAYSTSFNIDTASNLLTPYRDAVYGNSTGGATADVINSSWGSSGDNAGGDYIAMAIDALANDTGKTFVFSAGNSGTGPNNVGSPGSGFNSITVGSVGNKASDYTNISSFSSRSPSSIYNPQTLTTIAGARAAVDIVAPGENLVAAYYGGATGGNAFGGATTANDDFYSFNIAGTSFSAPTVAGGATLVADVARDQGRTEGLDGRVIKSILMNSADKNINSTGGIAWNNGQSVNGSGVIVTTQALDYGVGAGRMDLANAYSQLTAGTMGIDGTAGGNVGSVQAIGWDLGVVTEGTANEYYIAEQLAAGTNLTVTLNWFVDVLLNAANDSVVAQSFDDLSLEVWKTSGGTASTLVAQSDTVYDNVEHLYFTIADTANYLIRVLWDGEVWDLSGDANSELYGLAWYGTAADVQVPAAPVWLLLLCGLLVLRRRAY